jgi:hypothetical protein
MRSHFLTVRVINLNPPPQKDQERPRAWNVSVDRGDGCSLPYVDGQFDWVFSNATLEHVGGTLRQWCFCREMMRVAKIGYFLSTPNYAFPIDPHTYIPGYHWMGPALQKKVVRFAPGFMDQWQAELRLVSKTELKSYFPWGNVFTASGGSNLVAFGRKADHPAHWDMADRVHGTPVLRIPPRKVISTRKDAV